MRLQTNSPMDKLLDGGFEKDAITNVYALSCINHGKKAVYMDTEGSFSAERFGQLGGTEKDLKNIIFMDVHSWEEQCREMKGIEGMMRDDIGIIVVDSIVSLYRLEMDDKKFGEVNRQLATQYSILSRITRKHKIPVLVTNQIYGTGEQTEITSRTIAKYWSKTMIELKRSDRENMRSAILRKHRSMPEGLKIDFEITKSGLKETGKFGIF
ncbi:MAG: DNA repair protein RadB [Candidatus Aenigmarchaeota archaeon]|nr:DNA repair protein RadB [Candidatus Aenigmarchaeota archaeon]